LALNMIVKIENGVSPNPIVDKEMKKLDKENEEVLENIKRII